jgi:hypothetical protein
LGLSLKLVETGNFLLLSSRNPFGLLLRQLVSVSGGCPAVDAPRDIVAVLGTAPDAPNQHEELLYQPSARARRAREQLRESSDVGYCHEQAPCLRCRAADRAGITLLSLLARSDSVEHAVRFCQGSKTRLFAGAPLALSESPQQCFWLRSLDGCGAGTRAGLLHDAATVTALIGVEELAPGGLALPLLEH